MRFEKKVDILLSLTLNEALSGGVSPSGDAPRSDIALAGSRLMDKIKSKSKSQYGGLFLKYLTKALFGYLKLFGPDLSKFLTSAQGVSWFNNWYNGKLTSEIPANIRENNDKRAIDFNKLFNWCNQRFYIQSRIPGEIRSNYDSLVTSIKKLEELELPFDFLTFKTTIHASSDRKTKADSFHPIIDELYSLTHTAINDCDHIYKKSKFFNKTKNTIKINGNFISPATITKPDKLNAFLNSLGNDKEKFKKEEKNSQTDVNYKDYSTYLNIISSNTF
jgi:hypothetical protein